MLDTAYLRLVLIVLLGSYFPFLALAACMDWKLLKECARIGIPKPARFIDGRSTSKPLVAQFVEVLRKSGSRFALWLTIWEFVSNAYFWLLIAFLSLVFAALVSNLMGMGSSSDASRLHLLIAHTSLRARNLMVF